MSSHEIYGIHAVTAKLQQSPRSIIELLIVGGKLNTRQQQIVSLASHNKVAIRRVEKAVLESKVGQVRHQGMVATCQQDLTQVITDIDELIEALTPNALILILDGIQDPHNLGACLRVANGAGVLAVIAPKDKASGITPVVRNVASGAAESTPYIQVTNLVRAMDALKAAGVWCYGLAGEAKDSLYQTTFQGKVAICMGSEGKGLRRLTRDHCDALIALPMQGDVESLNVSVATGVTLYEVVRQQA